MCNLTVDEQNFLISCIYGPNQDVPSFYQDLFDQLPNYDSKHILIGGDFNLVLDQEKDSKYRQPSHPNCVNTIKDLMEEWELIDIWRSLNPEIFSYTWHKTKPKFIFSRLDMFLTNIGLLGSTQNCEIVRCTGTDHDAVKLELKIDEYNRGPGI